MDVNRSEKNRVGLQLLAYVWRPARVFSVFLGAGSGVILWEAGAENSLHQICHDEALPQPIVNASIVYIMDQLGFFLDTLKAIPEGEGTLLDHCSIMCTSELAEGNVHSNTDFPMLIAGGGSGRLVGGQHIRLPGDNVSKAGLTVLRGAGIIFYHSDTVKPGATHASLRKTSG